jgi:alkaline phosphatase
MGHEHIRAGGYFLGRSPSFSSFPTHTTLRTRSADSAVTDSAAAATAIATGVNVGNGVLSLAIPGSGERLETLLERSAREGKLTGLATTTYLTHATPAAFGAHQPDRSFYRAIGIDLLYDSRPNVLLGGGEYGMHGSAAAAAGYAVVQTLAALQAAADDGAPRIAGLFGAGNLPYESEGGPHAASYPDLADMTAQALRLLGAEEKGFFLMIESGLIDKAAHSNDAARMVGEVAALDRAVSVAVEWAAEKQDILIIVTADHETGGITMVYDNGAGNIPSVSWTTTGHTAENVDLFAAGVGAERLKTVTDNSGIYAAIYQ